MIYNANIWLLSSVIMQCWKTSHLIGLLLRIGGQKMHCSSSSRERALCHQVCPNGISKPNHANVQKLALGKSVIPDEVLSKTS